MIAMPIFSTLVPRAPEAAENPSSNLQPLFFPERNRRTPNSLMTSSTHPPAPHPPLQLHYHLKITFLPRSYPLASLASPGGRPLQLAAVSSALASAPPAFRTPHARGRHAWTHALETDRRNAITMQRQERLARARGVGKDVDVQSIISQVMHEGVRQEAQRCCSSLFTFPLCIIIISPTTRCRHALTTQPGNYKVRI